MQKSTKQKLFPTYEGDIEDTPSHGIQAAPLC